MAALVEGQQYGLSAQDKINCNKSLVFVKLTDSALRSIEEYVKLKGDTFTKPTIEFHNNNGVITLPLNGSRQTYGFTLSNVEADGPQGSFECLRQNGHRSLESLGCMHMKMHIHANEDSYEKTRVKMAAAEQEHKKFCTKEIKPNGPHLGRKVKVKRPGLVVSPVKVSPPSSTIPPPPPPKTSFKPVNIPPVKKQQEQPKLAKQNPKNKFVQCPELLRQPIRDRIIHILAVRPYKRPELIVRLMNEGIREKDRKGITAILTQVGTLKGNVYTLANYLWNEVQENWKFCTQEELEIIRKRKQQFLNANSENEAPSPNSQPNCSPVQKRVLPDPAPTGQEPRIKKQRISHYNRPEHNNPALKNESSEHSASDKAQSLSVASYRKSPYSPVQMNGNRSGQAESSQKSPVGITYNNSPSRKSSTPNRGDDLFSSSSLNQRNGISSENSERNIRNSTSGLSQVSSAYTNHDKSSQKEHIGSKNNKFDPDDSSHWRSINGHQKPYVNGDSGEKPHNKILSHSEDSISPKQVSPDKPSQKEHIGSKNNKFDPDDSSHWRSINGHQKTYVNGESGEKPQNKILSHSEDSISPKQVSPDSNSHCPTKESRNDNVKMNGFVNSNSIKSNYNSHPSFLNSSRVTSTTNESCSNSPDSSSESRDSMEYNSSDFQVPPPQVSPSEYEDPDYVKEYGTIVSGEQRAQYKADFNAEYEEYLRLHAQIKSISRKFANLEDRLHTCEEGSEEFKKIKSRILKEYRNCQHDRRYSDALKKFNFLHCKLSHIKRLVMEYDNAQCVKS